MVTINVLWNFTTGKNTPIATIISLCDYFILSSIDVNPHAVHTLRDNSIVVLCEHITFRLKE